MELKKAETLAEVKATFEGIEENGDEWFSNLLASDDELTRWIEKGQVSVAATPATALLLRQRYGCQRLYFANVRHEALTADLQVCFPNLPDKIITTVLERNGENRLIKEKLREAGFSHYALLKRVVKINEPKPPGKVAAEFANQDDFSHIEEIIRRYFDPLLDHWPDKDEIETAIREKRILVARSEEDGMVIALDSFEQIGQTVYNRYVVSMEEYRHQKSYGTFLMGQSIALHAKARRIIGWVKDDNYVSIHMHNKHGLHFDGATEESFLLNNKCDI